MLDVCLLWAFTFRKYPKNGRNDSDTGDIIAVYPFFLWKRGKLTSSHKKKSVMCCWAECRIRDPKRDLSSTKFWILAIPCGGTTKVFNKTLSSFSRNEFVSALPPSHKAMFVEVISFTKSMDWIEEFYHPSFQLQLLDKPQRQYTWLEKYFCSQE